MQSLSFLSLILAVTATPVVKQAQIKPLSVKSATILANVTDPTVSRDSGVSCRLGSRTFWVYRDTEPWNNQTGHASEYTFASSASWSDLPVSIADLGNGGEGAGRALLQYGNGTGKKLYLPMTPDMCPPYGFCSSDNTRWVNWIDAPPLIVNNTDKSAVGYIWAPKSHLKGLTPLNNATSMLYELSWSSQQGHDDLPTVTLLTDNCGGFGQYGHVLHDNTAYLYKSTPYGPILAKTHKDSVANVSSYTYWSGTWGNEPPIPLANLGTEQGTFYFSKYHNAFLWIGAVRGDYASDFYASIAPQPQGPWSTPVKIYSGTNGNGLVGAYSLQANPGLLSSTEEAGIYLTWTEPFQSKTYGGYLTPLAYLEWN